MRRNNKPGTGIFVATVAGDLATYLTTAVQLAVAYPVGARRISGFVSSNSPGYSLSPRFPSRSPKEC